MKKLPLSFFFALALFFTLFGTVFFPSMRLMTFAPFLAIALNRVSLSRILWISFCCGAILDLLSAEFKLGLHALNFVLVAILAYPHRRHFFEDKAVALSLFSALIALAFTLLQLILLHLFDKEVMLSWKMAFTDFLIMPALDGLYAFLWFTCPMRLYIYVQKVGWRNLLRKKTEDEA